MLLCPNIERELSNKLREIKKLEIEEDGFGLYTSSRIGKLFLLCEASSYEEKDNDLNALIDSIITEPPIARDNSYCKGLVGLFWIFRFLENEEIIDIGEPFFDQFESNIGLIYDDFFKKKNWDFLHGGMGLIVYILESKAEALFPILDRFITFLNDNLVEIDGKWGIPEIANPDSPREERVNLGLAHGLPGLIIVLSKIIKLDCVRFVEAIGILKKLCDFMLANKNVKLSNSIFPNWISVTKVNNIKHDSRLAWCYGDLGIGLALYYAGKSINEDIYLTEADSVFNYSFTRVAFDKTMVKDAGICHGTSGIAAIYNRMWFNTNSECYKEARDFWIKKTLEMASHRDGLAGFKLYHRQNWFKDYGLLEGVFGIGLTLASIHSSKDPSWDRFLLLS